MIGESGRRKKTSLSEVLKNGGGAGIRTLGAFTLNGFQDRRFRPLSHPSKLGRDYIDLFHF
jgi:hypothetical protein